MKRFLFLAAIAATSTLCVKAQKGSVLVGGEITYTSASTPSETSNNNNTSSQLEFSPFVGYQFTNNITAGVTFGISSQKDKTSTSETKTNLFMAGPFIRYTKTLSDIFSVYGQFEAVFGSGKNTYQYNGSNLSEAKYSTTGINLFPAVFINVKKGFGLNFNIGGLTYVSVKPEGEKSTSIFSFTLGKSASIGISKNF